MRPGSPRLSILATTRRAAGARQDDRRAPFCWGSGDALVAEPDRALWVDLVHLLLGDARLVRHVQVAGEDPVQDGRHREADERGDVGTAESGATGDGPG